MVYDDSPPPRGWTLLMQGRAQNCVLLNFPYRSCLLETACNALFSMKMLYILPGNYWEPHKIFMIMQSPNLDCLLLVHSIMSEPQEHASVWLENYQKKVILNGVNSFKICIQIQNQICDWMSRVQLIVLSGLRAELLSSLHLWFGHGVQTQSFQENENWKVSNFAVGGWKNNIYSVKKKWKLLRFSCCLLEGYIGYL